MVALGHRRDSKTPKIFSTLTNSAILRTEPLGSEPPVPTLTTTRSSRRAPHILIVSINFRLDPNSFKTLLKQSLLLFLPPENCQFLLKKWPQSDFPSGYPAPRPGAAAPASGEPPGGGSGRAPLTHALRVQVHGRHLLQRDVPGAAIPAPREAAEHGGGHGRTPRTAQAQRPPPPHGPAPPRHGGLKGNKIKF